MGIVSLGEIQNCHKRRPLSVPKWSVSCAKSVCYYFIFFSFLYIFSCSRRRRRRFVSDRTPFLLFEQHASLAHPLFIHSLPRRLFSPPVKIARAEFSPTLLSPLGSVKIRSTCRDINAIFRNRAASDQEEIFHCIIYFIFFPS